MARYKKQRINTVTEYVDYIKENCIAEDILFRGQPCDKPLVPKLGRISLRYPALEAEKKMIGDFRRRAISLLNVEPKSAWDWLAIAQHHGMATRLLDWTLNPLAALWFAVREPPVKEKGKLQSGVVWILRPKPSDYAVPSKRESPFRLQRTKIFRPRHIAPRLVTQTGWFTVHKFMRSRRHFLELEKNRDYSSKLTKLQIPARFFVEMRSELDRFNVNSAALFPDIDGLCAHIQWVNSHLADED